MFKIQVSDIINFLGDHIIQVKGSFENRAVAYIKPIEETDEYTLDWINSSHINKQEIAENSLARVIICDPSITYSPNLSDAGKVLIQVDNPRLVISMVANKFFSVKPEIGISKNTTIHPEARIAPSVSIDSYCVVGKCVIGENTIIHANVTIYDNVIIGDNCLIHAGTVIGTDGLGCNRLKDGTLVKFPHFGGVEIGNDVEIGANCQIARGALSNTIIGDGSKLNGLCFIAHNCVLGKNVWITGNTMLAGSVKVKDNVTIYSGVIIREQRTIGKESVIGMGSVVTKDIPDNEVWFGSPAKNSKL